MYQGLEIKMNSLNYEGYFTKRQWSVKQCNRGWVCKNLCNFRDMQNRLNKIRTPTILQFLGIGNITHNLTVRLLLYYLTILLKTLNICKAFIEEYALRLDLCLLPRLTWIEGLFKWPRFEVVCLGSWPSTIMLGLINRNASITT